MTWLPDFYVVALETTAGWEPTLVKAFGRIHDVHLIDRNRRVHICSFTPMYEAHYLRSEIETRYDDADANVGRLTAEEQALVLQANNPHHHVRDPQDLYQLIESGHFEDEMVSYFGISNSVNALPGGNLNLDALVEAGLAQRCRDQPWYLQGGGQAPDPDVLWRAEWQAMLDESEGDAEAAHGKMVETMMESEQGSPTVLSTPYLSLEDA